MDIKENSNNATLNNLLQCNGFFNFKTINMKKESIFNSFAEMGKAMYDMYESPHELAAIWLNMPVLTNEGITTRITEGMKIYYKDGCIALNEPNFNKEIITCYGTLINQFRIKVKDLETGIEEIINL